MYEDPQRGYPYTSSLYVLTLMPATATPGRLSFERMKGEREAGHMDEDEGGVEGQRTSFGTESGAG